MLNATAGKNPARVQQLCSHLFIRIMLWHRFKSFRNASIPQGFSYIYNAVSHTIFPVLWQQGIQYLESYQVLTRPGSRLYIIPSYSSAAGRVCVWECVHTRVCPFAYGCTSVKSTNITGAEIVQQEDGGRGWTKLYLFLL